MTTADMNVIQTDDQLKDMVAHYLKEPVWAFDVETRGPDRGDPQVGEVAWISFACNDRADVIPMSHPHGELLWERPAPLASGRRKMEKGRDYDTLPKSDLSDSTMEKSFDVAPPQLPRGWVMNQLHPMFMSMALKVGHNVKFDLHAVAQYLHVYPEPPYYDTLIASWLLDATLKGRLSLDQCISRELGEEMEKGIGKNIDEHPFSEVASYSMLDAHGTFRLYMALDRKIRRSKDLQRLMALEMAVLTPVLEMEATGSRIDTQELARIGEALEKEIDDLRGEAYRIAGRQFNLNSNKEKQRLLFSSKKYGGQGLKPLKPTPKAKSLDPKDRTIFDYSVDNDTMEHLSRNKLAGALLAHAKKGKLHSTYVVPYLGGTVERSSGTIEVESRLRRGRVFSQFVQSGTESGRFSSKNPNLQNIPSRSEDGRRLRKAFIADPGWDLIVADYSQIEPRIIAALSGDKQMIQTYMDGGDVYQMVGDRTGVERRIGKELVLSIAYGVGTATIANKTGISQMNARDLMDYFNRQFPAIQLLKQRVVLQARKKGYAETLFHRRRKLDALRWSDPELRSKAERQAFNHLVQGTAADIMKIALVNVHAALPPSARMLMTVHDEVTVTARKKESALVASLVKTEMEAARPSKITVPLVADVGIGDNWLEAK